MTLYIIFGIFGIFVFVVVFWGYAKWIEDEDKSEAEQELNDFLERLGMK